MYPWDSVVVRGLHRCFSATLRVRRAKLLRPWLVKWLGECDFSRACSCLFFKKSPLAGQPSGVLGCPKRYLMLEKPLAWFALQGNHKLKLQDSSAQLAEAHPRAVPLGRSCKWAAGPETVSVGGNGPRIVRLPCRTSALSLLGPSSGKRYLRRHWSSDGISHTASREQFEQLNTEWFFSYSGWNRSLPFDTTVCNSFVYTSDVFKAAL